MSILEELVDAYNTRPSPKNAMSAVRILRLSGNLSGCVWMCNTLLQERIGTFIRYQILREKSIAQFSICLRGENSAVCARECFDTLSEILSQSLSRGDAEHLVSLSNACIGWMNDDNSVPDSIQHHVPFTPVKRNTSNADLVTFTITTCKRFDLFRTTMDSFLNSCTDADLIDRWICVDDNSSPGDRERMREMYPFFEFYFKSEDEKGHSRSMNILRSMVLTPYVFHMEDDWKFLARRNYIADCMQVLLSDSNIKQCLVNRNYAETASDGRIHGGVFRTTNSGLLRFYTHEHGDFQRWTATHGEGKANCNYWPHFSFRPSLFDRSVFDTVGEFNEGTPHFEMEFAYRYQSIGYISAFLEGIYSIHIGRLTSERHDPRIQNAYAMNGVAQFGEEIVPIGVCVKIPFRVLNLNSRPDRWSSFLAASSEFENECEFVRHPAVNGSNLVSTPGLQRLFDGNDYNMRVGIVGCALSHLELCVALCQSDTEYLCVLEDDVTFARDFPRKMRSLLSTVPAGWDLIYLGHHLYSPGSSEDAYDPVSEPVAERWGRSKSLSNSMGGTGGYVISRAGAAQFLEFVNETGMTNGIDTMQQKSADILSVYYSYPHLVYSECFRGGNGNLDSDIQFSFDSLSVSEEERLSGEIAHFKGEFGIDLIPGDDGEFTYRYSDIDDCGGGGDKTTGVLSFAGSKLIIGIPGEHSARYLDRIKKDGVFDLKSVIRYK